MKEKTITKKEQKEFYEEAKTIIIELRSIVNQMRSLKEELKKLQQDELLYLEAIKLFLLREKLMEERIAELEYIVRSLNLLN